MADPLLEPAESQQYVQIIGREGRADVQLM